MNSTSTQVKCPECAHEFDVNDVLAHQADERAVAKLVQREREAKATIAAREQELAERETAMLKSQNEIDLEVQKKLSVEKEALTKKLKLQVETDQAEILKSLQEEIEAKGIEASALKTKELTLLKEKRALEEKNRDFETELGKKLLEAQTEIEDRVRREEQDSSYLKVKEREKKIADLLDQIEDLKRKAEQGSIQSQGDIQEVELDIILNETFRFDQFTRVKKGQNGADLIQLVVARNGREVGGIAWESKRTKAFSDQWIPKLKEDMMRHGAELGVIVTETMPSDMPFFGLRDGVWICRFNEAVALAGVLRTGLLRISEVQTLEINKGDKMQMLYDYLMGTEFRQQMDAIVNGFAEQKDLLEKEKRVYTKLWKQREKSIDAIINNALSMDGSIKGIAGANEDEDELLNLEAEYPDISLS
jgi:hypothetical protein